jgi:hypothetical protein
MPYGTGLLVAAAGGMAAGAVVESFILRKQKVSEAAE